MMPRHDGPHAVYLNARGPYNTYAHIWADTKALPAYDLPNDRGGSSYVSIPGETA